MLKSNLNSTITAAMKDILRKTLEKLSKKKFKRFKNCLRDSIAWAELEKADREDTIDLMVNKYTSRAGEMTANILENQMGEVLYASKLRENLMKCK